jgi:SOS-response transcriptional repressor LexA
MNSHAPGIDPLESEPTPRQAAFLALIRRSLTDRGYPPTVRELGVQSGISSPNGVAIHLKELERKGLIVITEGASRGITLVAPPGHCRCCGQPLPTDPTP